VAFANGVPSWLFMLWGGVIADRMKRRDLIIITQTVMMILAFILAGLTFTHLVRPWHIIVLAFCLGWPMRSRLRHGRPLSWSLSTGRI